MTTRERVYLFGAYALFDGILLASHAWELAIVVVVAAVVLGLVAA